MLQTTRTRSHTLDTFRGSLLFLVMVGHLFTAPVTDDPSKWTIYGFHIPLFMALSGYTLNLDALRSMRPAQVARKYGARLFLPWIPVFGIFTALSLHDRTLSGLAHAALFPWHHLWYVPALAVFILSAYVLRLPRLGLLAVATLASGVSWIAFGVGRDSGHFTPDIDPRLGTMAAFFAFGLWLAAVRLRARCSGIVGGLGVASLAVWAAIYALPGALWQIPVYAAMNFAIIAGLPWVLARKDWSIPGLREIGLDSMFFYLWHPLPMLVMQKVLYPKLPAFMSYPVTLAVTIGILFLVRAAAPTALRPWIGLSDLGRGENRIRIARRSSVGEAA